MILQLSYAIDLKFIFAIKVIKRGTKPTFHTNTKQETFVENITTVNARITPRELICKKMNFWMGAYSRGGGELIRGEGLISKFSIFLKGRNKNAIVFLTNLTKN